MKKQSSPYLMIALSIISGCNSSDNTDEKHTINYCENAVLPDGTIKKIVKKQLSDGGIAYGYEHEGKFILHRQCNDLPTIENKIKLGTIRAWYQHGNYYRDNDKPNTIVVNYDVYSGTSYRTEEWRSGSWYYLSYPYDGNGINNGINPDELTYSVRKNDKPNYISGSADSLGNLLDIYTQAWRLDYDTLHRLNAPAQIYYSTNGETVHIVWENNGKRLKEKDISSCQWYIDSDNVTFTLTEPLTPDTFTCNNEDLHDAQYLKWTEYEVEEIPISEHTYTQLQSVGIEKSEAQIMCRGNENFTIDCSTQLIDSSGNFGFSLNAHNQHSYEVITNEFRQLISPAQVSISFNENNNHLSFSIYQNITWNSNYDSYQCTLEQIEYNSCTPAGMTLNDLDDNEIFTLDTQTHYTNSSYNLFINTNEVEQFPSQEIYTANFKTAYHPIVNGEIIDLGKEVAINNENKRFMAEGLKHAMRIHELINN
ncbi:hypothetical protein ACFFLZ_02605 [Photobacterium aphoticum]|uniref:Uncharacterized protein n=1 Tax=Photobacterium aphoticum TaxID=754436 RepID=A0A0J1JLN6_9GAMM|nr:hypothetical protein [Photobacterium aphoticum]KLV03072.1 hypothetical protein ABT58_00665 [Photobacterium aphoticum]PSU58004.1 hypothetical protein C9I90_08010 [Photobacterium aphoticum]GHA52253.1 hypothetical protein GCM10007086_28020 [Photobacterium aphoticum]